VTPGLPEPPALGRLLLEAPGASLDVQHKQLACGLLMTIHRLGVRADAEIR
jgi:hypothetical protein